MLANTINKSIAMWITTKFKTFWSFKFGILKLFVICGLGFVIFTQTAEAALVIQAPKYIGLNSGLVGYWSFNGPDMAGNIAYDRSGNANNGTLTNDPIRAIGKLGQALSFDGVDDEVNAGSAANLDDLGPMTISAWINPRSAGEGGLGTIISKNNDQTNGFWHFSIDNTSPQIGAVTFIKDGSTNLTVISSNNAVSYNTWQHILMTWSESTTTASNVRIYKDGIELTYQTQTNGLALATDNTENLIIGNRDDDARTFDGQIDDVRIYNRALSADEIRRLYRIGATLKVNTSINNDSLTKGLVGYWSFDGKDMAGVTAYDRSGNSNNGTLTNGPTRAAGKLGQGLNFGGDVDYVNAGNQSVFNVSTISVSAWILTTVNNSNGLSAVSRDDGTNRDWILGMGNASTFRFAAWVGNVQNNAQSDTNWSLNQWHHVVGVYDGTNVMLYTDGVRVATTPISGSLDTDAVALRIGNRATDATGNEWDGKIDDVRVYNRALSASEIQRLYNLGR